MYSIKKLFTTTVLSVIVSRLVHAADEEAWRTRTIYQLVTDRFARSDDSASTCDTSQRIYCGGTWRGITNHLDYIQGLGFDAIWISPVVQNINQTTPYGEAYHGYWTQDINNLNSRFGTADDLRELSNALHSRGMYLMFDVVVNHFAAPNNTEGEADFSALSPFSQPSNFHPRCLITDYNNQTNVEQCWLGDTLFPLPDLNTEDPVVVQTMNDWIRNLVRTYSVDGIRIDTAKHVRRDFWPDFVDAADVFAIGEVITDQVSYAAPYTDVLDGVLDYPTWTALTRAFSSPSGNFSDLIAVVNASQQLYDDGLFNAGSFLENHDQPRFQNLTQDQALVRNAITYTFTHDGIPILYYGQEQGFQGGSDPANREALWTTGYITESKPLVDLVRALNAVRKLAISRNDRFAATPAKFIAQPNPSALAVSKPPLLTLLTNVGSNGSQSVSWSVPASSGMNLGRNQVLVDVLTCNTVSTDGDGNLSVQADGGSPKVLVAASELDRNGPLCQAAGTRNGDHRQKKAANWAGILISAILVTISLLLSF